MLRLRLLTTLAIVLTANIVLADSPPEQTISLNQVWAFNMPGTRDVRQIGSPKQSSSFAELLQQSLGRDSFEAESKPGFVVQADDVDVLKQAYELISTSKSAKNQIKPHSKAWIIFFSRSSGQFVHIYKVEKAGNDITVSYRFVPHDSHEMTAHFALIPIDELSVGHYRVNIDRCPLEKKYVDVGFTPMPETFVNRIICKSFEFDVTDDPLK